MVLLIRNDISEKIQSSAVAPSNSNGSAFQLQNTGSPTHLHETVGSFFEQFVIVEEENEKRYRQNIDMPV